MLGERQGAGSFCHAAALKRAEPHRAIAAGSAAGRDAPRGRLRSLPARPCGQGRREGRMEGGLSCPDSHEPPCRDIAAAPAAQTRARDTRGALPRRMERRARPAPRRHAALPRGDGARTGHLLPAPDRAFSSGGPFPPRHGPRPGAPCPPLGADGVRGAAGARAARPHSPPGGRLRPPSSSGGSTGGSGGSSGTRRVPETEAREEVRSCRGETAPFPGGGGGCGPGDAERGFPRARGIAGRGSLCLVNPAEGRGRGAERGHHTGRVNAGRTRHRQPRAPRPPRSPWPPALGPRSDPAVLRAFTGGGSHSPPFTQKSLFMGQTQNLLPLAVRPGSRQSLQTLKYRLFQYSKIRCSKQSFFISKCCLSGAHHCSKT